MSHDAIAPMSHDAIAPMSHDAIAPMSLDTFAPMDLDTIVSAIARGGELRAGGTDVTARQRIGRATPPFIDLRVASELHGIVWRADGSARIGAMTTIAEVVSDDRLRVAYPALTATAGGLATPQVRAAGTIGGNLLQRNRCWYYRNPAFSCFQTGGDSCPARDGLNLYSAVIDQGPCVAPHASSIAVALLAHEGVFVDVQGRGRMPFAEVYGDGSDPTRDHLLDPSEVLLAVELPVPMADEGAAYHRAIGRAEGEWPLVEAVARLVIGPSLDGDPAGVISSVAVAVGGVAHTPLLLPEVAGALVGKVASADNLLAAAELATERCAPLPQTGYKVDLLRDTVLEVLERAADQVCNIRQHVRRAD